MEMQHDLSALVQKAELSLSAHLSENPTSKHKLLAQIYAELKAGVQRNEYPTARDLFWDDPQSKHEELCLSDALAVFNQVRLA